MGAGLIGTAPLAGPTSSSPGGISDWLVCVLGSADRTNVGMVKVPALALAMHSTRVPGVTPATGPPDAVVAYRAEDAETLIVSMGTIGATAERVVDLLRERGQKVGSLRVRLFRPLPTEDIRTWFAGKQWIAVIDRDISLGFGGVLWGEVRALADPGAVVQSYMAGLGGGDVRPEQIGNMLADLLPRKFAGLPMHCAGPRSARRAFRGPRSTSDPV